MKTCPFPIGIMSFNRPDLLSKVLSSLKSQSIQVDAKQVYLFQDGFRSRFSDNEVDSSLQEQCVARFLEAFPDGCVLTSTYNLGVALNFERAERCFFENIKAECGIFFEDDLVLGHRYLEALLQMADFALNEPSVAYVGAYGEHRASLKEQKENRTRIIPLRHKWGFALTQRQWNLQRDIVEGYLDIIRDCEYKRRDGQRISAYFASLGYDIGGTSQDAAKDIASLVLGTAKLMCYPCFGKYIGKEGVHSTSAIYEKEGYGNTVMFDDIVPDFDFPSKEALKSMIEQHRDAARSKTESGGRHMNTTDALLNEALKHRDQGDYIAAEAMFIRGDDLFPDALDPYGHPVFRKELMRMLLSQNKWDRSKTLIPKLNDIGGGYWHEILFARAYAAAQQITEATAWWTRILARDPSNVEAKQALAIDTPAGAPVSGCVAHASGTPIKKEISRKLFSTDPFLGFDVSTRTLDQQGWNGQHGLLASLIDTLNPKVIFDVGVWKGQSTFFMAEHLKQRKADGAIVAIDTWLGSPEHWNLERPDRIYESLGIKHGYPTLYFTFLSNAKMLNHDDVIVPLPQTSQNAAVILKRLGVRADLIHLDAAHEYEAVKQDCEAYWDVLQPGGVMVGDDYPWAGVKQAAHEFADKLELTLEVSDPKWSIRKPY